MLDEKPLSRDYRNPGRQLVKGMRQLNGVYTQAFNKRHGRVGHVFRGRFKAVLVQKDTHFWRSAAMWS
jgi:hypothetical protein